jgi:hypothetical protein
MTDEEYKRLIRAARKATADKENARWVARLKALGAVEPQGMPPIREGKETPLAARGPSKSSRARCG